MQIMDGKDLSRIPLKELEERLASSKDGLTTEEAQKRLEQYGYNEIPEKRENVLLKFISYFWGPIPVMIMIAAALSGILRHWADLGVILALLFFKCSYRFQGRVSGKECYCRTEKTTGIESQGQAEWRVEGNSCP